MKDEKCGTRPSGCDTGDEKQQGDTCSTSKPHEEKKRGCGCGGSKK